MSNVLSPEKQTQVVHALAEGNSIRSIERMTGIHRDTIMRLGVRVGEGCHAILDKLMRNLECRLIQCDEIWAFVGKKQRNASEEEKLDGLGDAWTFVAVDVESRMVPTFHVGKRDSANTEAFIEDLAGRLNDRPQVSTDAFNSYIAAIDDSFGGNVDYGQVVKIYGTDPSIPRGRYSPAKLIRVKKKAFSGEPDEDLISTSYVERQNLTMRMHMRRLTRLTNAFSKKLDNFKAAVALHFGYYNLVRVHKTLRTTPAVAGRVTDHVWTVPELVEAAR